MFHRFHEKFPVTTPATAELRKTALNSIHRRLGAKMVNFGGWDMPLEYSGILAEHQAVRTRAGLFDVSHMGEIEIRGPGALRSGAVGHLQQRREIDCRPGAIFRPDDRPRHLRRRSAGAQNFRHALFALRQRRQSGCRFRRTSSRSNQFDARVENAGPRYSQLAIQGPRAKEILQQLTPFALDPIRYYHFMFGKVSGVDCLIARTGYTGEDGFEIYFDPEHSEKLWNDLMDAGESARHDSLRPGRAQHAAPRSRHVPLRP